MCSDTDLTNNTELLCAAVIQTHQVLVSTVPFMHLHELNVVNEQSRTDNDGAPAVVVWMNVAERLN